MSDYTTVYVKRETSEKIKQLAEIEGRLQYALVERAIDYYERAIKIDKPDQSPAAQTQPTR